MKLRGWVLAAVALAFIANPLAAQEHEEHEPLKRHKLALFVGYTWVPTGDPHEADSRGTVIAPTVGIDYSFWISHKVGVGLVNEVELTTYVVETRAGTTLPREYAYIGAAVGMYEVARGLGLYAGPGIELEKHENFLVLKVGAEYSFAVAHGWATSVAFGYDFKDEYDSWMLGLGVARRF
ncbi:MAG: hypothetical protein JSW46_02855 [Gemmatimonadota bacterium]|nr:MAG: hypothetical protein JSW46_02855 [Gemmatimonadota bacterium]